MVKTTYAMIYWSKFCIIMFSSLGIAQFMHHVLYYNGFVNITITLSLTTFSSSTFVLLIAVWCTQVSSVWWNMQKILCLMWCVQLYFVYVVSIRRNDTHKRYRIHCCMGFVVPQRNSAINIILKCSDFMLFCMAQTYHTNRQEYLKQTKFHWIWYWTTVN